jgi:hypothetical protein
MLEGTDSYNYVRPLNSVNGETYSGFLITNTTTQLSTSENDSTTVTFNM